MTNTNTSTSAVDQLRVMVAKWRDVAKAKIATGSIDMFAKADGMRDCASDLNAWLSRKGDALERPQWRDIADAPKDGTRFLAYQGGRSICEVWWEWVDDMGGIWMDDCDSEPEPTAWMPLPAPPVSRQQDGET